MEKNSMKLSELDPRAVATEVVQLALEHVHRLLFQLDPGASSSVSPLGTSLGFSTMLLAQWAKTGTNGEQWDAGMAVDGIQSICEALYSCAGEPGTFGVGPLDNLARELDAEDSMIDLLLLAAHGRVRLCGRSPESIHYRELAALGGISPEGVRKLTVRGELRGVGGAKDGLVHAADAKRWLGARGVPGFAAQ